MPCIINPFWPIKSASGSRSPWPVTPCRVGRYPNVLPLCSHSFLSVLSALGSCWRKGTGQDGELCGVQLSGDTWQGQQLSGDAWLGVCGKPGLSQRNKAEPVHLVVRHWDCSPQLHTTRASGAAEQLSDHFLLSKSKSFHKKAGYCCFVKFFNGDYRNCTQHLWNMASLISCVAKTGWGERQRECMVPFN